MTILKKGYLTLAASLLLVAQAQATELLNSSYDVSRELFAALNPPFEQQWAKDNGGDKLTISCRFVQAGAGDPARPEG